MSWPQQRLPLWAAPSLEREDFIVAPSNAEAVARIDAWPDWPSGALALIGPPSSGKTHLGNIWARRARAETDPLLAAATGGPLLLDDAHDGGDDERLFHLLNGAEAMGGLLLTAPLPPREWAHRLPDLRSRLAALPVAELKLPDDALLEQVLARLFAAVGLRPDGDVIPYLVARMDRSLAEARALVVALDARAAALARPVTRALAREVLEARAGTGELFD